MKLKKSIRLLLSLLIIQIAIASPLGDIIKTLDDYSKEQTNKRAQRQQNMTREIRDGLEVSYQLRQLDGRVPGRFSLLQDHQNNMLFYIFDTQEGVIYQYDVEKIQWVAVTPSIWTD